VFYSQWDRRGGIYTWPQMLQIGLISRYGPLWSEASSQSKKVIYFIFEIKNPFIFIYKFVYFYLLLINPSAGKKSVCDNKTILRRKSTSNRWHVCLVIETSWAQISIRRGSPDSGLQYPNLRYECFHLYPSHLNFVAFSYHLKLLTLSH
jgi:hypothetical protein